ncbi:AfsR/SARP family transcriptional regulator [Glycomyces salinus]|uniref:AfsR/SARP family transcriptional regulator n=1 Tax=Glycomyces salinus TaxID=980294 RepID=UPI0018EC2523|nr:BTAD domain-containing putative transcriptional regulator [Glycomyces salinus]
MTRHRPVEEEPGLRVDLLGPLVVSVEGSVVRPTGSQVPRLLSLLALRNGMPVRIETVIDVIWSDSPPAQSRRVALNLVGRLRRLVGGRSAVTHQGAISLAGATTDLDRFRELCADAYRLRRAGDETRERASLEAALRLVRGVPFAEWEDDAFFNGESARLQREIDRARLRESKLALDQGDHDAARRGAEAVLAGDPLSQEALGILMSALAAAGRVHEALAAYQDVKGMLAEETGLDPDPGLTALYSEILRTDGGDASEPAPEPAPVPRQLPRLPDHVSVHPRERTRARRAMSVLDTTSPAIVAVNGPGGIGKSAFALELAHSLKKCYPDGQLFADLHGNAPGHEPLDTGQVVRRFLRSLGAGGDQWIDVEEAAAHFRSVTADRQVLIVLDDVRDAAQIRPLLPNGSSCGVIVTSRRALPSLRGARHISLSYLDRETSRVLFRDGVDHRFTSEDEAALDGVLDRCGGLPLALCIAAARFNAGEPGSLPVILDGLSDERLGLSGFDDGENSLAASLAGSLEALAATDFGAEAAELFTLLALHPGPAVPVEIAAALADKPVPRTRHLGELLRRYRLVEQDRLGDLAMHDLVRSFAAEEARKLDRSEVAAAEKRMRSAYLGIAVDAYRFYRKQVDKSVVRNRLDLMSEHPASPIEFASSQEIDEWLVARLPALTEVARTAGEADRRFPGLIFILVGPPVGVRAGMISELVAIGEAASAAPWIDDEPWSVYFHHDLAAKYSWLGDHDAGIRGLGDAERSALKHGLIAEALAVRATLVRALQRHGREDEALELADKTIAEARQRDLPDVAERVCAFRSYILDRRGEHDAAIEQSAQLAALAEDETAGVAPLRRSMHLINHAFRLVHGGRAAEGLTFAEAARAIAVEEGFEKSETYIEILWGQAEAQQALGDAAAAECLWKEAAELMLASGQIDQAEYDDILAGRRPRVDPAN